MRKCFLLSTVSLLVIFVCLFFWKSDRDPLSESSKLTFTIVGQTIQEFSKKYNFIFAGIKEKGSKDSIELIGLDFLKLQVLNKNDIRKLVLDSAQAFIQNVNNFEEIQPFLKDHPFSLKNTEIKIFFYKDGNYTLTLHPEICCVSLVDNYIYFSTNDPVAPHLYKSREKETIEEAIEIVKQQEAAKNLE